MDIQDLFILQIQQNYLNIQNCGILIQMFKKKVIGRPMVHYNCTLVDIRHLINLKCLVNPKHHLIKIVVAI
jgi:hypothetical protein